MWKEAERPLRSKLAVLRSARHAGPSKPHPDNCEWNRPQQSAIVGSHWGSPSGKFWESMTGAFRRKAGIENSRSTALAVCCEVKQKAFTPKWPQRMSVHHIKVRKWIMIVIRSPEQIKSGLTCFGLMWSAQQCRNTWYCLERFPQQK